MLQFVVPICRPREIVKQIGAFVLVFVVAISLVKKAGIFRRDARKSVKRSQIFFRIGQHVGLKSRAHRVAIYTRRFASRFLGADKSARQIAECKKAFTQNAPTCLSAPSLAGKHAKMLYSLVHKASINNCV